MTDTIRTETALIALLATNSARSITAQTLRDVLVSTLGVVPYLARTSNYTATENDVFIACDATGGAITITLPACASTRVGKRIVVKKIDNANNVILDGNASETIDGATTKTLSAQWAVMTIVNSGSSWLVENL
jgi:hypothetical protein